MFSLFLKDLEEIDLFEILRNDDLLIGRCKIGPLSSSLRFRSQSFLFSDSRLEVSRALFRTHLFISLAQNMRFLRRDLLLSSLNFDRRSSDSSIDI